MREAMAKLEVLQCRTWRRRLRTYCTHV